MRSIWMLAGLAGLVAAPAWAQDKIPPSHLYSTQPPLGLDKDYGLPKSVLPPSEVPQQKPTAKQQDDSNAFTGLPTDPRSETEPSETPNFFQASPGLTSPDAQTSNVPNFFQEAPDTSLPKVAKSQSANTTMDTPLYTTNDEAAGDDTRSTDAPGDTRSTDAAPGDTVAPDAAATH
jgi:hypothetical protein